MVLIGTRDIASLLGHAPTIDDLDNDYEDFRMFKDSYNAINGAGAFEAALRSLSVPEPCTLVLVAAGCLALLPHRKRLA